MEDKKFGMFAGVFTPTVLTILGAIMYLRTGWVVGNAGIGGAFAIILLAHVITVSTGLAVSSVATNTRVGAGGAFAIISQSLGLEVGGSVGIRSSSPRASRSPSTYSLSPNPGCASSPPTPKYSSPSSPFSSSS